MSVAFVLVGAVVLASSVLTVRATRLVSAVLWLGLMLGATALVFVQLSAPFLAGIQLLLYVGGVMTLMIFGVMLTRRDGDGTIPAPSRAPWRGAVAALLAFAVLATGTTLSIGSTAAMAPTDARSLGTAILTRHVLAFEALSGLLLAAMIGAIVLARKRDTVPSAHEEGSAP